MFVFFSRFVRHWWVVAYLLISPLLISWNNSLMAQTKLFVFSSISPAPFKLSHTNHLSVPLCYRIVQYGVRCKMVAEQYACRFTFLVSFVIEGFNASLAHVCRASPAGLLLMSRPPCESTLSLSLPIILEQSLTSNVPIYTSPDM